MNVAGSLFRRVHNRSLMCNWMPDGESVEGSAVHAMPKRRNVNLIPTHKRGFNAAKPKNGQIGCHGSRPCMISRSEEMKF